jgi:hypothetical protein
LVYYWFASLQLPERDQIQVPSWNGVLYCDPTILQIVVDQGCGVFMHKTSGSIPWSWIHIFITTPWSKINIPIMCNSNFIFQRELDPNLQRHPLRDQQQLLFSYQNLTRIVIHSAY